MPEHEEPLNFPFAFPPGTAEPGELALLREESPVTRVALATGDEAWLVTRHSDVQLVLNDERFSRAAAEAPDAPRMGASNPGPDVLLGMDGPDHARLRRLAVKHFTTRRVERLRPWTQRLADRARVTRASHAGAGTPRSSTAGQSTAVRVDGHRFQHDEAFPGRDQGRTRPPRGVRRRHDR